jgi:APA family basic amino acid/polyamine antiporter
MSVTPPPQVEPPKAIHLDAPPILRRWLGSPALFGIVQGFIGASIYFILGLVAQNALGLTWVVYAGAAGFFVLLMFSYVEGASLHPERGGATVIARYAFNELWSFVAGWAILLDYLILIAITAFAAADYASAFYAPLAAGAPEVLAGVAIVLVVAFMQIRGGGPTRYERAALFVLADLLLQLLIVVLGLALLFEPEVITDPSSVAGTASLSGVLFAFTLAIVAFTGLDASSGLAGEVAVGRRGLKRLISARVPAAVVPYIGIGLVAASTLPADGGLRPGVSVDAPMLGVVGAFDEAWLREPLTYLTAAFAVAVLFGACNAAMLGLSRIGYSLALNRQIPSTAGRLHPRYATPVVVIGGGTLLAVALLIPADLEFLAGIYAFGATIAFVLVTVGVCVLRWREPTRDRPYKMPLNVKVGRAELPVPAAVGAVVSAASFVFVLLLHESAALFGLPWLVAGVALYVGYRTYDGKPVFKRVTVPEKALTRIGPLDVEYGSILVPVLGTTLDDDIMQTAGRLAGSEQDDLEETGATIEALWVFEVPMALPINARVPESELKRAKAALARARAVGEEYEGVKVATASVRARRAGEAIVHEAKRRGVEAIVLAAEEPTRLRGGPLLGGKQGLRDTFVGETTRYVVNKAPCRVILTAPPAEGPAEQRPEATERFAPPPAGDPMAPSPEAPPAVPQGPRSGDDGAAPGR